MLIAGLGNPGAEYKRTYHNVGFMVIDAVLNRLGKTLKESGCNAKYVKFFKGDKKVVLAKPQTYMNRSGIAVRQLLSHHNLKAENALIIFDDLDLPAGDIRIREKGSGGTHNGMKNVVEMCGQNIPRLRVGIGKPPEGFSVADYVLTTIKRHNEDEILAAIEQAADYVIKNLIS